MPTRILFWGCLSLSSLYLLRLHGALLGHAELARGLIDVGVQALHLEL